MANVGRGMAEKVGHLHAGNRHRPLKSEEQPRPGALVRLHGQQVAAVQLDSPAGYLVARMPHQGEAERALSGAVWAHQGVDFAAANLQAHAAEDRLLADAHVQVGNR